MTRLPIRNVLLNTYGTFFLPPMPVTVVSVSLGDKCRPEQVAESREIPPLPVSRINVSGWEFVSSVASMAITPPTKGVKGTSASSLGDFFCAAQQENTINVNIVRIGFIAVSLLTNYNVMDVLLPNIIQTVL